MEKLACYAFITVHTLQLICTFGMMRRKEVAGEIGRYEYGKCLKYVLLPLVALAYLVAFGIVCANIL